MSGMGRVFRAAVVCAVVSVAVVGLSAGGPLAGVASAAGPQPQGTPLAPVGGPPGYAMAEPAAGSEVQGVSPAAPFASPLAPINATYVHAGALSPAVDLPPGNGDVMTSTTIRYVFWLPTGLHYESNAAGDTNYENLLIQWTKDLGSSQEHNIVTQYFGNNGTISNTVNYGGSWTDTSAYPHAGTVADPLQDSDIQNEVKNAVSTNSWPEGIDNIVAVFTANGIFECGNGCMSDLNGFCAYHDHFSDSGNDAIYAFMGFDNFVHHVNRTCVAGQTSNDTDPNRGVYPNGDVSADAEINTLSHEVTEAETDPHPNDTWTAPNPEGEIGDACNFNFAPRNDNGADVFLNGHGYIMQQEYSNAAHTCAIDLPTNGFCSGSVGNVCSPTTTISKTVDNASPRVLSTIHYTVTLNNPNDTGAETNLSLADTVPSGYTVTNLSAPSSTSSSFSSSGFSVGYDTLPVHQSRTVTVTASVPTQAGTTATNCATLDGQDLLGTALTEQTSSPCAATTPVKIPTILTYTGATTGDYRDQATVQAVLTDDSFNPLMGKQITFTLNGTETCNALTDFSGTATCQLTPHESAGNYTVEADFSDTSDPVYAVSGTTAGFQVTTEETTTTYTGPTVILGGASGATLTATLVEDGANDNDADGGSSGPVPSEPVTLSIGSQHCSAMTDSSGNVTCTISPVTVPLGPETVGASFAGDGFYSASSDSKSATVFAFPSRGAFTIGDTTAATAGTAPVTWWSDTWQSQNALSGGATPASFKGFADAITLPTTSPPVGCGSAWTTSGGSSPPPTSGVPAYMGVVVTSAVSKSGSTISGNAVHIVVVKVNPGYAPNSGHAGTGTIVKTFC